MTIAAGQQAASADILKTLTADGYLQLTDSTELTIASGAVTVTANFYRVDTESNAATDDLDTITAGTGVSDGHMLVLRAENDARTVVVKHNTGNIKLAGDNDVTLDDAHDSLILVYDGNLTKWIGRAADIADGSLTAAKIANRTRTFMIPVFGQPQALAQTWSSFGAVAINGYELAFMGVGRVPSDFVSGMTAQAIIQPDTSGNLRWSQNVYLGAAGEAYNTHTASTAANTLAVTEDVIRALTSLSLSSAAAGDYIACEFTRYADNVADTVESSVNIAGFLISYTADS